MGCRKPKKVEKHWFSVYFREIIKKVKTSGLQRNGGRGGRKVKKVCVMS
jgi:hypothetical protein